MSNSPLADHINISPNSTNPRNDTIKKITIHHMAGDLSVEQCGNIFAAKSRQASSNYGVDSKGRVGLYVEEKNRSWCSSSRNNDHQAITIEVANDEYGGNWHVSDTALSKLIELCIDICKRNDIPRLIYTGDASGNLTMHNMFADTNCPGPYLGGKFPYIVEEVNKALENSGKDQVETAANADTAEALPKAVAENDIVSIADNAVYYNGKAVPGWVKDKYWIVSSVNGDRAVIDRSQDGKNSICSPINTRFLTVVKAASDAAEEGFKPFLVKIEASVLNIRKGPGINYPVAGCITDKGVYTIVETADGQGSKKGWGKLKSGAGWISLGYCSMK